MKKEYFFFYKKEQEKQLYYQSSPKIATSSVFKLERQFLTYKLKVMLIISAGSQMEEDNVHVKSFNV